MQVIVQQKLLADKRSMMEMAESERSAGRASSALQRGKLQQQAAMLEHTKKGVDRQCEENAGLQAKFAASQDLLNKSLLEAERKLSEAEQRFKAAKEAVKLHKHDRAFALETLEVLQQEGGKLGKQIADSISGSNKIQSKEVEEEKKFQLFVERERAEMGQMEGVLVGLQTVLAGALASAAEVTRAKKAKAAARHEQAKELARQAAELARQAARADEECEEEEALFAKLHASLAPSQHTFTP